MTFRASRGVIITLLAIKRLEIPMLECLNRHLLAPLALAPLLALAACGGGAEDSAEGETASNAAAGEQAEAGMIEADIDGQTYTFQVGDGSENGVTVQDNDPISVVIIRGEADDTEGLRITLMAQRGAASADTAQLFDGPEMNPLESELGLAKIEFDNEGEGGVYSGSFSATLDRVDAQMMTDDMETVFEAPLEISGTFNAQAQ